MPADSTASTIVDVSAPAEPEAPELPSSPTRVVGDTFIAETEQGEIRIRLTFKTKLIRAIRKSEDDELDQFLALLDGIGDKRSLAQLDELDFFETQKIVAAFFRAFQEKQGASVGEASRSSS